LSTKRRFRFDVFYVNILIILLFIVMFAVGYETLKSQEESIRVEVDNTAREFETRIQTGVASVLYLHATAGEIFKNPDLSMDYVSKIHEINAQGDFVLDQPHFSNLTGYGGMKQTHEILHEMATSLALTRYFRIVKGLNRSFERVYYLSKNHFATIYPFMWSDQFVWKPSMMDNTFWKKATPALNPNGKLFYTSIHRGLRNERPLVTVGHPIYNGDEFIGTVNLDIDLGFESAFLESKNLHDGTYAIVNEEGELVAASGLKGHNVKEIIAAKRLLSMEVLSGQPTTTEPISLKDEYLYVKSFENVPWRLFYIKKKIDLYITSLIYVGIIFIIILLLFRVKVLMNRLAQSNYELEFQALTDPMTKLYNRRYLTEMSQQLLELAQRNGSQLSVLMLDIDKFKNVNDTYGHKVGDDVIIILAETLQEFTRKSDVVCRLGGEEFVVLLPDTPLSGALKLAETLRSEVEALEVKLEDNKILRFTISIGVTQINKNEKDLEISIARADGALYEAKEGGRNKVCYVKPEVKQITKA